MRINVYAEELTDETELVTKTVTDEKFGERTFYGIRVYLKSPPELHADPEDDDRSAITFWVPWTRKGGHDFAAMALVLGGLGERFNEAIQDDERAADAFTQDATDGFVPLDEADYADQAVALQSLESAVSSPKDATPAESENRRASGSLLRDK